MEPETYYSKLTFRSLIFLLPPIHCARRKLRKIVLSLIREISDDKKISILEIGAGSGEMAMFIGRNFKNVEYYALDLEGVIRKLRKKKFPPNVHLVGGDFRTHTGQYDFILTLNVFQSYRVDEWLPLIQGLTKKNGFFFFTHQEPCIFSKFYCFFLSPFGITLYPERKETLKKILISNGYFPYFYNISPFEGIYGVLVRKN